MLDIFENNNLKITNKLVKRILTSDKKRNFFIIIAIALTALMISSVFSVCFGIIDSLQAQKSRLYGSISHAAVPYPTPTQIEQIKSLDYVKFVGLGCNIAHVKKPPQTGDISLSMVWLDDTQWNKFHIPAYTDVMGNYPQTIDEIMTSRWVLEKYGITDPEIGMPITLEIKMDSEDSYTERIFTLSGYFTSYMHIQSEAGIVLASESLVREYEKTIENDGALNIIFNNSNNVNNLIAALRDDITLNNNQVLLASPIFDIDYSKQIPTLIALATLIVFLMFTGYLLIYNVMYISVSRDIRFYGLLKTIGVTQKQIRKIVIGQILRLCCVGIPLGLISAALVSLIIVPLIVLQSGIETGVVISFSPIIFISAGIFSLLTAVISARRPANKAARISPVEAVKYTDETNMKYKIFDKSNGKPYKMALRNIFRNSKQAAVVFLSLFLGLTTFITAVTLTSSMNIDAYIQRYFEADFSIENKIADQGGMVQLFDEIFLDKLEKIEGIENIYTVTQSTYSIEYSEEAFGKYVQERVDISRQYGSSITAEHYIAMFSVPGKICGLDKEIVIEMNKSLDSPIDVEAFDRGEIGLIGTDNPSLFNNVKELEITCGTSGNTFTVQYGGVMTTHYRYGYSAFAPMIFVSNNILNKYEGNLVINTINLKIKDDYDAQQVYKALTNLIGTNPDIYINSRFEGIQQMKDAKVILYVLGGGLSLILAGIGIMNFINIMSVNILVRRRELATMESIGMTENQIRKMLFFEGMGYGLITVILTLIFGNLFTFIIYHLLKPQVSFFVFSYPLISIIAVVLLVLIICAVTPEISYRSIAKSTISDRLRMSE
jgi:ABC-type transport system, involved in lipoprotein release, permease component